MIKPVTLEDLKSVSSEDMFSEKGLGFGKFENGKWISCQGTEFDPEVFRKNWLVFIQHNIGAMWWLMVDGKIRAATGATFTGDMFVDIKVATQVFSYLHPDHISGYFGASLFDTFYNWAVETMKANKIVVTCHHSSAEIPKMEMCLKRGFRKEQLVFSKVV
jgi:hypothetical protein